jgi:hypothetical protein
MNLIVLTFFDVFYHIKHISLEILHLKYLKFWTKFRPIKFNSTYTRIDLYASIYGTQKYKKILFSVKILRTYYCWPTRGGGSALTSMEDVDDVVVVVDVVVFVVFVVTAAHGVKV